MDTKEPAPIKCAVIFDTNVFDRIVRNGNEAAYDHVIGYLNSKKLSPGSYGAFLTPFLFMEYMGVSVKKLRPELKIHSEQFGTSLWKELLPFVFLEASKYYAGLVELKPAALAASYSAKKTNVSPKATALFEDVAGRIASSSDHNILAFQLALDYAYSFNLNDVPGIKDGDIEMIHLNVMLDIFRVDQQQKNVSVARGIFNTTDYLANVKSAQLSDTDFDLLKQGKHGLKLKGDLGDLDLVHVAVAGAYLNNTKYPVIAFTADPEASVRARLKTYKETANTLKNVFLGLEQPDWRSLAEGFAILPGEVVVLSADCTKTICVIDVSSL